MATTVVEQVSLDRTTPTRAFANLVAWELREDDVKITTTLTRAVLTLTPSSGGAAVTYDSTNYSGFGSGNMFYYAAGILYLDLSAATGLTAGLYNVSLDVYDGSWYAWSRGQSLQLDVKA